MTITRIDPMSAGKVGGVLGAGIGLLIGALTTLAAMTLGSITGGMTDAPASGGFFGMLFGIGAIIILPIFYAIVMFIGCLLQALLYNFAAGFTGGLEIDTK